MLYCNSTKVDYRQKNYSLIIHGKTLLIGDTQLCRTKFLMTSVNTRHLHSSKGTYTSIVVVSIVAAAITAVIPWRASITGRVVVRSRAALLELWGRALWPWRHSWRYRLTLPRRRWRGGASVCPERRGALLWKATSHCKSATSWTFTGLLKQSRTSSNQTFFATETRKTTSYDFLL